MRENIGLYRGKHKDTGEWMYGSLLRVDIDGLTVWIIFGSEFEREGKDVMALTHAPVDPDTVAQYTGLTDKNGKKIFEGDVVVAEDYVYVCQWNECNIEFELANEVESFGMCYVYPEVEIIGNIHDNPELLKAADG